MRGRLRDAVMRALSARSVRAGDRQRAAARIEIGLPARRSRSGAAADRDAARAGGTAARTGRRRPSSSVRCTSNRRRRCSTFHRRDGPVVVVAPSTATTGTHGLAELALEALRPGTTLPEGARVAVSTAGRGPRWPSRSGRRSGWAARTSCSSHADRGGVRRRSRHRVQDAAGWGADGGGARRGRPVGDRQSRCATRQCRTGPAADRRGVDRRGGARCSSSPSYREAATRAAGRSGRGGRSGTGVP